jgi:hypothetical protein
VTTCFTSNVLSHARSRRIPPRGEQSTHSTERHLAALLRAIARRPMFSCLPFPRLHVDIASTLALIIHSPLRPPTTNLLGSTPWRSASTGTQRQPEDGRAHLLQRHPTDDLGFRVGLAKGQSGEGERVLPWLIRRRGGSGRATTARAAAIPGRTTQRATTTTLASTTAWAGRSSI